MPSQRHRGQAFLQFAGRPGQACADADPDLFFPSSNDQPKSLEAIACCDVCAWKADCLSYALTTKQEFGIWGGTTSAERYKILTGQKRANRERASRLGSHGSLPTRGKYDPYTPEERTTQATKCLAVRCEGLTIKAIAARIGISCMTAKKRIEQARREAEKAPTAQAK
ncbi:MAG: WhiB family transcriptional regulator [Micromonospora sp.]